MAESPSTRTARDGARAPSALNWLSAFTSMRDFAFEDGASPSPRSGGKRRGCRSG
ncbi:MAG: hypothetical protein RXS42_07520 [Nitrososphaeria archaeon]